MQLVLEKIITIFGIMLNVIGAWYISRCLIKKTNNEMVSEASTYYTWNDSYVISAIKQRIEGNVGIFFIIFGAVLQISMLVLDSNTFILVDLKIWISFILVIFVFILLLIFLLVLINIIIKRISENQIKAYIKSIVVNKISEKTHIADYLRYIRYINKDYSEANRTRQDIINEFKEIYNP